MESTDLTVDDAGDGIVVMEIHRPPANYFDVKLITALAEACEQADCDEARVLVLCSEGKHFCAGADFRGGGAAGDGNPVGHGGPEALYRAAGRLFARRTPMVAAVQGAAVGGGLGLALAADFRVATPTSRFAANFSRIGLHPGFGITTTLPSVVGRQRARDLLITGRSVGGDEALAIGLADRLAGNGDVRERAHELAREIASAAPLAVRTIRAALVGGEPDRIAAATDRELAEQDRLRATADFSEGVRAAAERRTPNFTGR